jgi:hypothetical protein
VPELRKAAVQSWEIIMAEAATEEPVAVISGPKGEAEIVEVWSGGRLGEYQVRFNGQIERFPNIGEAYIAAGEKTGTKT